MSTDSIINGTYGGLWGLTDTYDIDNTSTELENSNTGITWYSTTESSTENYGYGYYDAPYVNLGEIYGVSVPDNGADGGLLEDVSVDQLVRFADAAGGIALTGIAPRSAFSRTWWGRPRRSE